MSLTNRAAHFLQQVKKRAAQVAEDASHKASAIAGDALEKAKHIGDGIGHTVVTKSRSAEEPLLSNEDKLHVEPEQMEHFQKSVEDLCNAFGCEASVAQYALNCNHGSIDRAGAWLLDNIANAGKAESAAARQEAAVTGEAPLKPRAADAADVEQIRVASEIADLEELQLQVRLLLGSISAEERECLESLSAEELLQVISTLEGTEGSTEYEFEVMFDLRDKPIGLSVDSMTLSVGGITPGSLAEAWNEAHEDQMILPDDRIVEVNGNRVPDLLLHLLQSAKEESAPIQMKLSRTLPCVRGGDLADVPEKKTSDNQDVSTAAQGDVGETSCTPVDTASVEPVAIHDGSDVAAKGKQESSEGDNDCTETVEIAEPGNVQASTDVDNSTTQPNETIEVTEEVVDESPPAVTPVNAEHPVETDIAESERVEQEAVVPEVTIEHTDEVEKAPQ
uniref:PDZ domain-containing protein n=1 Tax=Noctiluca scintillans TaxID=2966 RepID=A0A7S1F3W0_NOCSC|mmetsp:Transcript_30089/g.80296  ORF Transcript_30089/g.80296 Transcript_30089/m.80296 type:complete len:449 (+) Transcript_30089:76-1422(+)